jgi:hypothetical protein
MCLLPATPAQTTSTSSPFQQKRSRSLYFFGSSTLRTATDISSVQRKRSPETALSHLECVGLERIVFSCSSVLYEPMTPREQSVLPGIAVFILLLLGFSF